jgi:hypothetical protein
MKIKTSIKAGAFNGTINGSSATNQQGQNGNQVVATVQGGNVMAQG